MQEADRTRLLKGWHRAVRCALFYAKETEEETGTSLSQKSVSAEASQVASPSAKEDAKSEILLCHTSGASPSAKEDT
mgnify:CR=1 FL=1